MDPSSPPSILADILEALRLEFRLKHRLALKEWLLVPLGIILILLACFGINSLIRLSSVQFPAAVALLVILFFALLLCDWVVGDRRTRVVVGIIDVPAGWALRYISLFFTPSFVLLPLSPPIGGVEVGKIIAVFLIGFVVMFVVTAYLTRGLQIVFGSSKRAITERAEEMGDEDDNIPLSEISRSRQDSEVTLGTGTPPEEFASTNNLIAPPRAQDPDTIRGTGGPPESSSPPLTSFRVNPVTQTPLPLSRAQRWATFLNQNFDRLTWLVLFLFIGIPIYYSTGYAMPAQLSFNVLAYFSALALPAKWRQFLHPVLVSSAITILGIWTLGLTRGSSLTQTLFVYKTKTRYLDLWYGTKNLPLPGAGDIFSSALDASIVALALPMFSYRHELQRHFFAIVIPNVTISVASLFGYPVLCYAIGISSERSLAFAARSLTLALATPAVDNLGGDVNTGAALAIMSGILGVLVGNKILAWLKIPEGLLLSGLLAMAQGSYVGMVEKLKRVYIGQSPNRYDYVTRGVTLGGNSSAIATALLLVTDPRAAALSSLSMSLFGIITLALTSVPPIVKAIQSLVDL